MTHARQRPAVLRASIAVLALAFVALCGLSPRLVPFSMDEFVHYHALGCAAFPLQHQHALGLEACGSYDLTPPGLTTPWPLRSYLYIGSLPALPFYPLWRLFDAPWVVRVQGALYFLAATVLLARLARVRLASMFVAGLVFPVYLASFIVDVGPVGLSLTLLAGALVGLRAALVEPDVRSPTRRAWLAGLAVFAGLWVKLVFAWALPALALCTLAWVRAALQRGTRWRRVLATLTTFALASGLPTALLLLSTDAEGLPYYAVGSGSGLNLGRRLLRNALHDVGRYLVDASLAVSPVGVLPHAALDYAPLVLGLVLLLLSIEYRDQARGVALWLGCAALTLLTTLLSGGVWGPHHLAFSLAFLVLALACSVDRLLAHAPWAGPTLAVVLLASWVGLLVRLPQLQSPPGTGFAKDRLLSAMSHAGLAQRDIVLHASWGTYYIGQLFGDHQQLVLAIGDPAQARAELQRARALAGDLGRGVAVVSANPKASELPTLRETFGAPIIVQHFEDWQVLEFRPGP